jgi:SpoVK/Ycf46/Vps4 family AAA+-type ATPase
LNKLKEASWNRVFQLDEALPKGAITKLFTEADVSQPSLILIDDLEGLASSNAESQGTINVLEREIQKISGSSVQVVATARRPIDINQKILCCFDEVIELPIPTPKSRLEYLQTLVPHTPSAILEKVAERTHAFTTRDLSRLCQKAYKSAIRRSKDTVNGSGAHVANVYASINFAGSKSLTAPGPHSIREQQQTVEYRERRLRRRVVACPSFSYERIIY